MQISTIFIFTMIFIVAFSLPLGTFFSFPLLKKEKSQILTLTFGIAIGMLLFIVFFDFTLESIEFFANRDIKAIEATIDSAHTHSHSTDEGHSIFSAEVTVILLLCLGLLFTTLWDFLLDQKSKNSKPNLFFKEGLVISVHNLSEGVLLYVALTHNIRAGIVFALSVVIHNLLLGFVLGSSLTLNKTAKDKIMRSAFLIGFCTLLGAFLGHFFFANISLLATHVILSFTGGVMLHLILFDLLPSALKRGSSTITALGLIVGFIIMTVTHAGHHI